MTRPSRPAGHTVQRSADGLRGASLRLTAQFTALVLILIALLGGIVYTIVANSISEATNRALFAAAQIDSSKDAAPGTYVTLVDAHTGGQIITQPGMPPGLPDLAAIQSVAAGGGDQRSQRIVDGRIYLLLTTSATGDHDRIAQVALDQHESTEELARLTVALLVGGAIAASLAFLAAYLMARRAIRPLADALALQRRFVADASHELRTPLTLLSTRAQMLKRRSQAGLPPDVTQSVDDLVTDTHALTGILDDLLIAADPRSHTEQSPVNLTDIADQTVGLLADDATTRGIVLTRTASEPIANIMGSPAALLRLALALTTNALDHARTSVALIVTTTATTATLTVADDGPGFTPGAAATAFDRFASNRATTATSEGGIRHYGLGLAIVSEIARRHSGTVAIHQAVDGGVVACTLPLAARDNPQLAYAEPPR